jgi:nucleotide-binding universal stress UspA family protein
VSGDLDPGAGPVLIAYDGSEHAQVAIEQAAKLLRPGVRAVVVTVWQPLRSIPYAQLTVVPEELADAMLGGARATAEEGAERARAAGFDAEALAVAGTSTWHRLIEVAAEKGSQAIVMGAHGHTGLARAAMGSVASAVAQHAQCPVLIGRAPGAGEQP